MQKKQMVGEIRERRKNRGKTKTRKKTIAQFKSRRTKQSNK